MSILLVNHHYFREVSSGSGIYPTSSSRLAQECALISASWGFGDQSDLAALASNTEVDERDLCIITFDDGLKEQIAAVKQLNRAGIKAICFVPTLPLSDAVVLDVHKLQMLRSQLNDEELAQELDRRFGLKAMEFDPHLLKNQYRYDSETAAKVKYFLNFILEPDAKSEWLSTAFERMFGKESEVSSSLYMDREELSFLAATDQLGSHGHKHLPLETLDSIEIRDDVEESLCILERLTGRNITGISYPYGGESAVGDKTYSCASELGLRYGITMFRGINNHGSRDRFKLSRIDTNDLENWLDLHTKTMSASGITQ